MSSRVIKKQPLAILEIPINKFYNEAIPFHQKVYETHKADVFKLIAEKNVDKLKRVLIDKKRVVQQLKNLLYELDTLRTQVEDDTLDRFDTKTFSLRKIISSQIKDYAALEKTILQVLLEHDELIEESSYIPFEGINQIQMNESINDIKLKQDMERLKKVESIHESIGELHNIYTDLNRMVSDQAEPVNIIEDNVENAQAEVNSGIKCLIAASKLNKIAYSLTGAIIGTIIGGPLGLVAGLKIGGFSALGCGVAGYTGGHMLKQYHDSNVIVNSTNENATEESTQTEPETIKDF